SSRDVGTAAGQFGKILRTTDGGATWIAQTVDTSETLYGVAFADVDHGFAVGMGGAILRTETGGEDVPRAASLVDDFGGDAIDPTLWNVSASQGQAEEQGGSLNLHLDSNTGNALVSVSSQTRYSLLHSQVSIEVPEVVGTGNVNNVFSVQLDWDNSVA